MAIFGRRSRGAVRSAVPELDGKWKSWTLAGRQI